MLSRCEYNAAAVPAATAPAAPANMAYLPQLCHFGAAAASAAALVGAGNAPAALEAFFGGTDGSDLEPQPKIDETSLSVLNALVAILCPPSRPWAIISGARPKNGVSNARRP